MRKISMLTGLMSSLLAAPAIAQDLEVVGRPQQGGVGFQPAATELARDLQWLDGMLLVIITAISLFVAGLLVYAFIRFNRRANPNPASFAHHTPGTRTVPWTMSSETRASSSSAP